MLRAGKNKHTVAFDTHPVFYPQRSFLPTTPVLPDTPFSVQAPFLPPTPVLQQKQFFVTITVSATDTVVVTKPVFCHRYCVCHQNIFLSDFSLTRQLNLYIAANIMIPDIKLILFKFNLIFVFVVYKDKSQFKGFC